MMRSLMAFVNGTREQVASFHTWAEHRVKPTGWET